MKRNLTWITVVVLILMGWAVTSWFPSSGADEKPTKQPRPPFVHTVVFYLKEDAPKNEVDNIIADAHGLLARIPSVKGLWVGRPAEKSTPELAVTDFHVAWVLLFDDFDGLQAYLVHPLHEEFREKHAPHAERVLVYDVVNQEK